ncbi:hypothetical protein CO611_09040 [Lysobacteraceae bacterium NML03-0222]|nr:hypothetical protein CO611_09040 [Xanthomonadaceae bacterium NML03-0222]
MTYLNVAYAASGGALGANTSQINAMRMIEDIHNYVMDYAHDAIRGELDKYLIEPLYSRGIFPGEEGQGKALALEMRRMSEGLGNSDGIILVLDDYVGATAQLNHSRNRFAAKAAEISGVGDQGRSHRRVVAEVIEGIRKSAEANPGPFWNRNFGPERYLRHIDQAAWREALEESMQFKDLKKKADEVSEDFVCYMNSSRLSCIMRWDFDGNVDNSSLDFEGMVAWCVSGSGLTKVEREEVWEPVLDREETDENNWLARALAAQNTAILAFMGRAPSHLGQSVSMIKGAKDITADLLVGSDGKMESIEKINEFRQKIRRQRAANAATSALIETASNVMADLLQRNPEKYHRLLRNITITGLTRDDLIPTAHIVHGGWGRIREWIMEVATGKVQVVPQPAARVGAVMTGPEYMTTRNHFKKGWHLSQDVGGAVLYSAPANRAETASVVFWVINRVQTGVAFNPAALSAFGLKEIDARITSPAMPENPMLKNHFIRIKAGSDFMLSSMSLLFQAQSLYGSFVAFYQGKAEKGEALKLLSASLAATSSGLELYVAMKDIWQPHTSNSRKEASRLAARIGFLAGVVEGVYHFYRAIDKYKRHDFDSAYWSLGTAVAVVAGSAAGYGMALAIGGGTATVLGVSLGPVGWFLLTLAFTGAAIYSAIQAFGTDDRELSVLEYWLDNGVFGRRQAISGSFLERNPFLDSKSNTVPPFNGVLDELSQLQRVTWVAQARFDQLSSTAMSTVNVASYDINLPVYRVGSDLQVQLFGRMDGVFRLLSEFVFENGEETPTHFLAHVRLTGGEGKPSLEVDQASGAARIKGKLGSGHVGLRNFLHELIVREDGPFQDVKDFAMILTYRPDREQNPDLKTVLKFGWSKDAQSR